MHPTPRPHIESLAEARAQWKQMFWQIYKENVPMMVIGSVLGIGAMAWAMMSWPPLVAALQLMGAASGSPITPLSLTIFFGTLMALFAPVPGLALAYTCVGNYPTAESHAKAESLHALYVRIFVDEPTQSKRRTD